MNKRRQSQGMRCPRCKIHQTLCFCENICEVTTKTRVSMIMHHRERHLTSNTVNLASLVLPDSRVHLRGFPGSTLTAGDLDLDPAEIPLYLFPHEEAEFLTPTFLEKFKNPRFHLIIPDGTWSQAVKIYRRTPGLTDIPCVKLPPGRPGRYRLRKSSDTNRLSTFEALARALAILESDENLGAMMEQTFDLMVERVLKGRTAFEN